MATYITKRCPHCQAVVERTTESHNHTFGSPVCVCHVCKKTYFDRSKHEIAIKGPAYYYNVIPVWCSLGLYISIVLFVFALILFKQFALVMFLIAAGFCFVYCHFRDNNPKAKDISSAVIEASEKRLSNPEYAHLLKDHGYDVPQRFLK